jgi:hypothetical protein
MRLESVLASVVRVMFLGGVFLGYRFIFVAVYFWRVAAGFRCGLLKLFKVSEAGRTIVIMWSGCSRVKPIACTGFGISTSFFRTKVV